LHHQQFHLLDVTEVDSQAGGNQTIVITGSNFGSGATVTFVGASGTDFNASTVTVDSDTQITAVAPKASFLNAQEPYGVKVENTSGLSGTLASQINVDTLPSWSTASGSLGNVDEGDTANLSVSATDPDGDTVAYSETGGTVLSTNGLSINSSTGAITGTAGTVSGDTTINFDLRATANSKTADRAFNIITADEGILASAEFYIDPSNSSSWSGSGSSLTNITNSGSKSGNTTNLSLNSASVETTSGITYIETASSDTLPTATIGNISGDIQNYTIVFFAKLAQTNGATDGGIFFYGNKNTNQAIGGVLATNEAGGINHYNYSNDSYFPAQTYNTWNMYTFRKVSGIKQFWYNTTQLSSISETNNTTSLPANSTFDYGGRNAPSAYIPYDFNLGFCGIWSTNISDSDITFLFNKFKGDYGL
jgi:hypothetical protein